MSAIIHPMLVAGGVVAPASWGKGGVVGSGPHGRGQLVLAACPGASRSGAIHSRSPQRFGGRPNVGAARASGGNSTVPERYLPQSPNSGLSKGSTKSAAALAADAMPGATMDDMYGDMHPLFRKPDAVVAEEETIDVFGYPRDLQAIYKVSKTPIGRGAFGVVRLVQHRETGVNYALKSLPKSRNGKTTAHLLQKIRNEVQMLRMLSQSHDVVELYEVFESDKSVHLVMELCRGGELYDEILKGRMDESRVKPIMRSVLGMVEECHSRGYLYRDIKPQNFMFMEKEGEVPEPRTLRAIDFGLASQVGAEPLRKRAGTPAYMSPEVVQQSYSYESDVWSVGMLAFQMLTGRLPFWEDVSGMPPKRVWVHIMFNDVAWEVVPEDVSPEAIDFLEKILEKDGSQRLTLSEAMNHPWLKVAKAAAHAEDDEGARLAGA